MTKAWNHAGLDWLVGYGVVPFSRMPFLGFKGTPKGNTNLGGPLILTHTVDGRHSAPPKKPWFLMIPPVNTTKRYSFNHGVISWCQDDFVHPQVGEHVCGQWPARRKQTGQVRRAAKRLTGRRETCLSRWAFLLRPLRPQTD